MYADTVVNEPPQAEPQTLAAKKAAQMKAAIAFLRQTDPNAREEIPDAPLMRMQVPYAVVHYTAASMKAFFLSEKAERAGDTEAARRYADAYEEAALDAAIACLVIVAIGSRASSSWIGSPSFQRSEFQQPLQ